MTAERCTEFGYGGYAGCRLNRAHDGDCDFQHVWEPRSSESLICLCGHYYCVCGDPSMRLDKVSREWMLRSAHVLTSRQRLRGIPLWSWVGLVCVCVSGSAMTICKELGWDPHVRADKKLPAPSTAWNPVSSKGWLDSCDFCASQGNDGHYCLLHGSQMKNMNILRCSDWTPSGA